MRRRRRSVCVGFNTGVQKTALAWAPGAAAVPEPSALAAIGLGALALVRRRRRDR